MYILSLRIDYLIHFAIYVIWMWLAWKLYAVSFRKDVFRALLWLLGGLVFANLSELIQIFVPYRAFNRYDLLANVVGVITGSLFFWIPGGKEIIEVVNKQGGGEEL
jgi:VanZ family protein